MTTRIKWFDASKATKADVPGYWVLGYSSKWSDPQVRVGAYDPFDPMGGNRFKLIGGTVYMDIEVAPEMIAALPVPK